MEGVIEPWMGPSMIAGRIIGWALLVIAALLLLLGLLLAMLGGSVTEVAGVVWNRVDADTLNLSQAITQRYIWPPLWDPVAINILLQPLWLAVLIVVAAFAVPGGALAYFSRIRRSS